ncbi:KTSC domain-containing protein [Bartonella sp. B30(2025)]
MKKIFFVLIGVILASNVASAETVNVKYHGLVNLSNFQCQATVSSFVHRICYQPQQSYVVVLLKHTYYHYCRVPFYVVANWLFSPSKGRFYIQNIKGNFDCRLGGIPN